MAARALYLHIPFCRSKCRYCDFDSRAIHPCELEERMARYLERLVARLDAFGQVGALAGIETVYIGGGTPTLLGEGLPELVRRVRRWCAPTELTCEANPESLSSELAASLADAGATRISLGVQSLRDAELAAIGRIHSAKEALRALACIREAGLTCSCDLMCGLPGQTLESWEETLAGVLAAGPDHVSVYPLAVEEGTPLAHDIAAGALDEPDEDLQAACMERSRAVLSEAGFAPYEVASYARPGRACAHNIAYWTGASYLGIGRSAAGMLSAGEYRGLAHLFAGMEPDPHAARVRMRQLDDEGTRFELESLSAREVEAEDLMLGARMTCGISAERLQRAARAIPAEELMRACERAVSLGLARWEGPEPGDKGTYAPRSRLVPTRTGWLEGNVLFELFWDLA